MAPWQYACPITLVLVAFVVRTYWLIKRRGFDPSLVTYASPITIKSYWSERFSFSLALITLAVLGNSGTVIAIAVLAAAAFHSLILIFFGRYQTQPVLYYILNSLALAILIYKVSVATLLLAVIIMISQELYLQKWIKSRSQRYNRWVASIAIKINHNYGPQINKYQRSRFWIILIATTEAIARPSFIRMAERLYFKVSKPSVISTGIMQVAADHPLTDKQSIIRGSIIIDKIISQMPIHLSPSQQLSWLAKHYNGSFGYGKYLNMTYPGVLAAWQKIKN